MDGPDHGKSYFFELASWRKARKRNKKIDLAKIFIAVLTELRITVHFLRKMSDSVGITSNFSKMVIFIRFQKYQYFEKALGLSFANMP